MISLLLCTICKPEINCNMGQAAVYDNNTHLLCYTPKRNSIYRNVFIIILEKNICEFTMKTSRNIV